jgi:hypothetical protein
MALQDAVRECNTFVISTAREHLGVCLRNAKIGPALLAQRVR